MIVPTPTALLTVLDQNRKIIHDRIVETIVDNIKKGFTGDILTFYIYESEKDISLVALKLKETMAKSNWRLEIGKTQHERDEDITKITLYPSLNPSDICDK